jgi:PEP-CTERM putative exosortase interaction domain
MEQVELLQWRWNVIGGSELGPDLNGGRLVCINGTGDTALETLTIDATKCAPEFPVVTAMVDIPVVHSLAAIPAVPEPSTLVLMLTGTAVMMAIARKRRKP